MLSGYHTWTRPRLSVADDKAASLRTFLRRGGWALISAERMHFTEKENAERSDRLKARLDALGAALPRDAKYAITRCVGTWNAHEETSFLVHGLTSAAVYDVAREFEQDAYIKAQPGDLPQLVTPADGHAPFAKHLRVLTVEPTGSNFTRIEVDGTPLYIVIDF